MSQLSLLPIRLVDEPPYDRSDGGGQDLIWLGIDEQDRRYALKTVEPCNPNLPFVEWLCYHLCGLAGVPTPEFAIVERIDGSLAFGSRWAEDATQFNPSEHSGLQLKSWTKQASSDISSMLALDAFLPNDDRHFRNVLFRQVGTRMRALAFDWSRATPFNPWPWLSECNSHAAVIWCKQASTLDHAASQNALSRLVSVPEETISRVIDSAPEAWRTGLNTHDIVAWWVSQRRARADQSLAILYK